MSKNGRKTIGTEMMDQLDGNPFELLTTPMPKSEKQSKEKKENGNKRDSVSPIVQVERSSSQEKERMTVQISKDTIERVKDCVYWNRLTVAQFVEEALEAALVVAEKENGSPFERRRSELKPGRPTK